MSVIKRHWVAVFKTTKTFPLTRGVNIYVLTKMPRDCTARPPGGHSDEQSGSCLPDPIQSMKNKKNKNPMPKRKPKAKVPRPYLSGVNAPAAFGTTQGSAASRYPIAKIDAGRCIVKNFELSVAYSAGSGGFTVDGYFTNPGIATNFPWLYTIARNYSKFRFLFLRYFYSASVSTATPGKAYITLSYDAQDGPPTTLAQAMSNRDSSTGPAWFGGAITESKAFDPMLNGDANIYVDADVSKMGQPWYYTRNTLAGVQPSSGGALTGTPTGGIGTLAFTQGTYTDETAIPVHVYYGTNGVTNAVVPGELYVAYIVEFCDPVTPAVSA